MFLFFFVCIFFFFQGGGDYQSRKLASMPVLGAQWFKTFVLLYVAKHHTWKKDLFPMIQSCYHRMLSTSSLQWSSTWFYVHVWKTEVSYQRTLVIWWCYRLLKFCFGILFLKFRTRPYPFSVSSFWLEEKREGGFLLVLWQLTEYLGGGNSRVAR